MMKTPRLPIALALATYATIAALISTPSSNIFAKPLPVNGHALHHPFTRPAPLLMPHNHVAKLPRRNLMRSTLRRDSRATIEAKIASNATPHSSVSKNIVIAGMQFRPALVHIKSGDQVTWENHEPVIHIISSPNNGLLASGQLVYGSVFKHTFNEPGIYNYYCTLNPAMMGIVIVN